MDLSSRRANSISVINACGETDPNGNLTPEFRNLKKHVKGHIMTGPHIEQWNLWERKEEEKKKELAKNEAAGMRLARTAYNGYLKGWSYTDFEEQVCLAVQNGMPMGDFHNSKRFPAKFMQYVYDEVHLLCEDFITKRTPETGFHPPVNVCVDKATSNHKSFQFTTAVVALANSEHLLANIFLGAPIVRDHTAQGLTNLICEELENNKIQASQVQGLSVDGQYIHWHVDHILKEMLKLGSTFKASWDALHRYMHFSFLSAT